MLNICSCRFDQDLHDNIGRVNMAEYASFEPIDIVYTWVNGSDPQWLKKKDFWSKQHRLNQDDGNHVSSTPLGNETTYNPSNISLPISVSLNSTSSIDLDDTDSKNRYRDNYELKYSLRSVVKHAPWIRRIYLVTDNQIPHWLNMNNGNRLVVLSHEDIFQDKSVLPVFSSPSIESQLHRIPGLSKRFIYFNDDVMLGSAVYPDDFISLAGIQRLYFAWDVPKCNPGCNENWIGDGACDKACNVAACNFDYPDCVNVTATSNTNNVEKSKPSNFCNKGCPDSWLGDRVCDQRCNIPECAYDVGDCGINAVTESFPAIASLSQTATVKVGTWNTSWTDNQLLSDLYLSPNGSHPIVLRVPIDSHAFHVNLSSLACLSTSDPRECPHQDVLGFKYASAISEGDELLQTSVLVHKHHSLVGILYHQQDNAPPIPELPYDINFTVYGYNPITNISMSAAFTVRVISSSSAIKDWNEAFPSSMGVVKGYAAKCPSVSCAMSGQSQASSIDLSPQPFHKSLGSAVDVLEGIRVRVPWNSSYASYARDLFIAVFNDEMKMGVKSSYSWKAKLCDVLHKPTDSDIACDNILNESNIILLIPSRGKPWHEEINGTWKNSQILILKASSMMRDDHYLWQSSSQSIKEYAKQVLESDANAEAEILSCLSVSYLWGGNTVSAGVTVDNSSTTIPTSPPDSSVRRRLDSSDVQISRYFTQMSEFVSSLWTWFFDYDGDQEGYHRHRRKLTDTYAQSLVHVNRLYNKRYGHENRKVPAHMPHMINKYLMAELQASWPEEWNRTSSNRFRTPKDMQYSFSYYYYLLNLHKSHPADIQSFISREVDTNHDGYVDTNEFHSLLTMMYSKSLTNEDTVSVHANCSASRHINNLDPNASSYTEVFPYYFGNLRKTYDFDQLFFTVKELADCSLVRDQLLAGFDWNLYHPTHNLGSEKDIAFEMISDNYTETLKQLDSVRRRKVKFICINDNMQNPPEELLHQLSFFYEALFPKPSIFELPAGQSNPTLYTNEYRENYMKHRYFLAPFRFILATCHRLWNDFKGFGESVLSSAYQAFLLLVLNVLAKLVGDKDTELMLILHHMRDDVSRRHPIEASLLSFDLRYLSLLTIFILVIIVLKKYYSSYRVSSHHRPRQIITDELGLADKQLKKRHLSRHHHQADETAYGASSDEVSIDESANLATASEDDVDTIIQLELNRRTSFAEASESGGDPSMLSITNAESPDEDILNTLWKSTTSAGNKWSSSSTSESSLPPSVDADHATRSNLRRAGGNKKNQHVQFDVPDEAIGGIFNRVSDWLTSSTKRGSTNKPAKVSLSLLCYQGGLTLTFLSYSTRITKLTYYKVACSSI
jgi:hypothetical protein